MSDYHNQYSCIKCSSKNEIEVIDGDWAHTNECETTCKECGHKDYWAYGFFQSESEMESKCKTSS